MQETQVRSRDWEDPLEEEGMALHSDILAWRVPWTEEPAGLYSPRGRRVGHDWATDTIATADNAGRHDYSFVLRLWFHCFISAGDYFLILAFLYLGIPQDEMCNSLDCLLCTVRWWRKTSYQPILHTLATLKVFFFLRYGRKKNTLWEKRCLWHWF